MDKVSGKIPVFEDPLNQIKFEKDGYVKMPGQIIPAENIQLLNEFFYTSGISTDSDFDVSKDHPDKDLVQKMYEKFEELIMPHLRIAMNRESTFVAASYIAKPAKSQVSIRPHQDDSFIARDSPYYAVTCWIPLVDVDEKNGCVGIVKGSHKILQNIYPSPFIENTRYDSSLSRVLIQFMEWVPMKAGELLLIDHSTVHASLPNRTGHARLTISLMVTHNDAENFCFCHKPGKADRLLVYRVNRDYYVHYSASRLLNVFLGLDKIEGYGEPQEIAFEKNHISAAELEVELITAGNTRRARHLQYFKSPELSNAFVNIFKDRLRTWLKRKK